MARFKVFIEYAGTKYSGWQIQKNARTVQGELTRVIADVTGQNQFELYGSGRTDAGVHALEQVAHLDIITAIPAETLRRRVNDALPSDIHILKIELAQRKFHARHDAVSRSYLYQISRRRTAFAKNFVWWVRDELDLAKMRATAEQFSGMKDFRSFTDDSADEKSTVVAIERIEVAEDGDLVLVRVEGSHFLWKMVRRMVGVMVDVGIGGTTVDQAARFLREDSGIPAKLTAPASGLFLERVYYRGETRRPALARVCRGEISTMNTMTERLITCPSCGTKNRLPPAQAGRKAVCGKCKTPLPESAGGPVEVTDTTFSTEVEQSATPVLLDMWADWCGPCHMLAPTIDQLSSELAGRVKVAKLNIDAESRDRQPLRRAQHPDAARAERRQGSRSARRRAAEAGNRPETRERAQVVTVSCSTAETRDASLSRESPRSRFRCDESSYRLKNSAHFSTSAACGPFASAYARA